MISKWFEKYRNQRLFMICLAIFVAILFILIAYIVFKPGFPLDDAWIHQTYARNLVETGHWDFNPGEKSAGSTSPLWTLLLTISSLLKITNPIIFTIILSIACYATLIIISIEQYKDTAQFSSSIMIITGLLFILDWHLLWGVGSGMEVVLASLVIGTTFLLLKAISPKWFLIGLLIGVSVWIRPDGITLIGPALIILGYKILKKYSSKRTIFYFFLGLLIPLVLYGLLNYYLSGKILPSTFFAKQAEYSQLLQSPLILRYLREFSVLISGVGFIFLPGFIFSIWYGFSKRNIWLIVCIAWILGFCLLYAMRLPVIYQHGRYILPVIGTFYVVGIFGSLQLFETNFGKKVFNKSRRVLIATVVVIISLIFTIAGESAFIQDLKTIDRLMVQPAQWINQNTNTGDLIAAHDIGALGYFSNRRVLDLAGLIQPDIILDLDNQEKILERIQKSNAKYLVVFQDWYPEFKNFGIILTSFDFTIGNELNIVEIKKIKDN